MIIAIDIGATNISIARFSMDGTVEALMEFESEQSLSASEFLTNLTEKIKILAEPLKNLRGIGVGSCGVIRDGRILYSPNTSWKELNLKEELSKTFKVPVSVINDADAFAIGVFYYEFKGRYESLCAITLGSGLGGALVSRNGVFSSYAGISPELGHITVRKNGRLCSCGKRGCLEAYASERSILQNYKRLRGGGNPSNAKELLALWKNGDQTAGKAFQAFGEFLGIGLASIHAIFSPDAFILGGGISKAYSAFLGSCKETLYRNLIRGFPDKPKVLVSKFLRKASLLGAFHLLKRETLHKLW